MATLSTRVEGHNGGFAEHGFVGILAFVEVQRVVGTSQLAAGLMEDWIWASWKLLSLLLATSVLIVFCRSHVQTSTSDGDDRHSGVHFCGLSWAVAMLCGFFVKKLEFG